MEELRKKIFILGLTGGIACGKTTVARMLETFGAKLIDFDIISRQVVEPGTPAYKEITNFFGDRVLLKDKTINRKLLSEIVFNDYNKRKRLESFTHKAIYDEYKERVVKISKEAPKSIIQAAVPLLIEAGMQKMFDKIMVVYIKPELQIQRLALRDKTSKRQATLMVESQMPVSQKLRFADFVINNEKTIEDTQKQVLAAWQKISGLFP